MALLTFTEDTCNTDVNGRPFVNSGDGLYPYIKFHITSSLQNDVYVGVCVCVCVCHLL